MRPDIINFYYVLYAVGLGGLGVTCARLEIQSSWVQIRLSSMDFFQDVKILITCPPGGTLS